ncbi:hypothetical protein [Burkholderia ambifaria]|uniref:hypothetical protein n=1 Tax=Burkholderia ambifaria TaxID=152480 RepID=UPI00158C506D
MLHLGLAFFCSKPRQNDRGLRGEGLSPVTGSGEAVWKGRYRSITELDSHLHRNDTRIVKCFLHLSKEEQSKRFLARIDQPDKNWIFSTAEIEERKFWAQYMVAYQG